MFKIVIIFGMILIMASLAGAKTPTAYVLNSTAETLTKINLTDKIVTNDIETIGTDVFCYPNQMMIRDSLMYVIASGTDEIQIIDLNSETTLGYILPGTGTNPFWFDFLDEQYLLVSLLLTNKLAKIDYTDGSIISETAVGKSPEGVLILGDKAYVACTGFDMGTYMYDPGKVYIYDIPGDSISGEISVGLNPQYMVQDSLGRVHVVCTGDYFSVFGAVYLIDTETDMVVDSIVTGGTPGQISISPDNIAYIAASGFTKDGYVFSYDALTGELFHNADNPIIVDLNCITVSAFQNSELYTGSFATSKINVIDSAGSVFDSYAVNSGPTHIVFNYMPGDLNGDFNVNLLDITGLIGWLYQGGIAPAEPRWRANANADKNYNLLDITYLIRFLYNDGERPLTGPHWVR